MLNLREYRKKIKGFSDLLNIAFLVGEGKYNGDPFAIALQKDSSFLSAFKFTSIDIESASANELENLSSVVAEALNRIGTGWTVHINSIRRPASSYIDETENHFFHPVLKLIDAERREQYKNSGKLFETVHYISIKQTLNSEFEENIVNILVSKPESKKIKANEVFNRWLEQYKDKVDSILGILSAYMNIEPLNGSGLLTHIHECLTLDSSVVNAPKIPAYLDAILGHHDFIGGFKPQIDGKYIKAISFVGFPSESYPEILENLSNMDIHMRFSVRFIPLDTVEATNEIEKYRKKWFASRQTISNVLSEHFTKEENPNQFNLDAIQKSGDAQLAKSEASEIRYGYISLTIILIDSDLNRIEENTKRIETFINNSGFVALVESANTIESFLGSIPGHSYENVRRPLVHAITCADLAPTTSVYVGKEKCPSPMLKNAPPLLFSATGGSTPFRLNLHVGDVGHTLVLGPTGAGKSTLLSLLVAQFFRYKNSRVISFDKGMSMFTLAKATGGLHYNILGDGDEEIHFAPLSHIDSNYEKGIAADWVEALLLTSDKETLTASEKKEIFNALNRLSETKNRSLTNFRMIIQNKRIKDILNFYTNDGRAGQLLDSNSDSIDLSSRFIVFELENLMNSKNLVIPVLLYIFNRIESILDGSPTMIVLDEAWVMLDNEYFSQKIKEWLKVLRKKNALVVFATQSVKDVVDSKIYNTITESCMTKIFLPNLELRSSEGLKNIYGMDFGLSDRQIELLGNAIPKRDYYIVNPFGRRKIDLGLGAVALAFCAVSSPDDIKRVNELSKEKDWVKIWLRERLPSDIRDGWIKYFEHLETQN